MAQVDEKTLKALIEIASKSAEPDAVEGVLAVQELMQENSELKTSIEALKTTYQNEVEGLRSELDKATRTMAKLIAQNGYIQKEDEEPKPVDKRALVQKFFG